MRIVIQKILLPLTCLFLILGVNGQVYNAKQISGLNSLSQSTINSICVDNVGYTWLGTNLGLNKYDGQTVIKYFSDDNDPHSLPDNFIHSIYEDSDCRIWISTNNGLCQYNRDRDCFIRNPLNLKSNIGGSIVIENETELWFSGNDANFFVFNKATQKVYEKKIIHETDNLKAYWIDIAVKFDESHFLVALHNYGLALFSTKTGKLKSFLKLDEKINTGIEKIGDYFYVSAYRNVYKVSKQGKIVNTFYSKNPELPDNIFLDVKQNPRDGNIWIASDFNGIFIVDKDFNLIDKLESGTDASKILPENSIKRIEFVNPQMVILGTVRCGAVILYDSGIQQFRFNNGHESGPSDKSILCIEEDSENNIWFGTDGEGINNYNRESGYFEVYKAPDVRIVTTIVDFSPGKLLVGSYQKGLFFFDKKTKQFSDAHKHSLFKNVNRKVRHKIYKDSKNNIWISDGSLLKVNLERNSSERMNSASHPNFFSNIVPIYFSVFESNSGKLWFSTVGGAFAFDLKTGVLSDCLSSNQFNELAGNTVYSIEEDTLGNLILGTGKGLYIYNEDDNDLEFLINSKDFNYNQFSALYFDKKNQLWAGTNEKLLRIKSVDELNEISVYHHIETPGGIEYRHGTILQSSDNKLYMGSNDGITCFIPEEIDIDRRKSNVVITSLKRIGNQKNEMVDSTIVVDVKSVADVTFRYAPAMYQVKFNAFNIPFEEYTEYSYTLENYEDIWHTGTTSTAVYTNLPAGEYTFKVKSTNRTGNWSSETTEIHINILPPWYQTAWFWGTVFILVLGITFFIWRESLVRLKLKHQLELQETEKARLKETNQQKLQFFTNISHELKTPLTLIYTPLKHLLKKNVSEVELKNALPSLYRNVRRMMALIEQLLEFRKAEMSTLKLKASVVDSVEVCDGIIEYFEYFSKVEGIKLIFNTEDKQMLAELDENKFTMILFNLISNALKHTRSGDIICISLNWEGDFIKIEVQDNGPGMPEEVKTHIFERYYQFEKEVGGTGIGLALTKHLVDLHNGKITVASEEGKGACFSLLFPRKQENIVMPDIDKGASMFERIDNLISSRELLKLDEKSDLKVLVVEDEWELRHFLKNELSVDYYVHTASNGKQGFAAAVKHVPDVIISDIMMPEMNGYQLCESIKNDIRISHIPIILLTAKKHDEDHAKGYIAGADMYVSKPFDLDLLKLRVNTLVKNRAILKERYAADPNIDTDVLTNTSLDKEFMDKAVKIVEDNMENQHFNVTDFVNQMGMSRSLVYNKINAIAGKPVKDFILNIRLQNASKLLTSTELPVSEIAYECGFSDPSYFSTVFKRYYSKSPVNYRNNYLNVQLTSADMKEPDQVAI